ncbi:signal recognition particle 19 protein, putative [Cryptosporidium muris RN66]|uniref:Signal recognition particle 19 protein, putative n=1 Tax=Cryptosporidium muris (strain RN66) TaxID=441375 RepID=B6ADM0_CRYMR|nr:signal recognition particle 19 protein, putative [Cryptosporidium muris RN66]EEA06311.1 signal recognition particle 19 protein, putative [Cryptosporidium muris RN66]|eukprot:XP_002140660.1 signal recognition particle 19 protein [Cryptosporidium muris RN66]
MVTPLSSDDTDVSRWKVIYPAYIDKNKTISKGRLISTRHCIECPNVAEMAEICVQLGIPYKIECKRYPRDFMVLGRLRYKLFNKDGDAFNDEILTKKMLLIHMGQNIPKLKSRLSQINSSSSSSSSSSTGKGTGVAGKCKNKHKKK